MKKFTTLVASFVLVAGLAATPAAFAQAEPAASSGQFKVGLIDMAFVFKNYKKFEALRNDLKAEIEQSDLKAKQMAGELKQIQEKAKQFKEGSSEFKQFESELAQKASQFEAFRKIAQRDFLRKEAEIYKTVYLEVSEAVELYANHYKYSLIMRFSRDGVEDASGNPQQILQSMNRQVVSFGKELDITDTVLEYLNRKYMTAQGGTGTSTK
ncbi:OmpH family outer membrane protein [Thalassoroseus pseudoceratinae]|uniref:OmpH family outer membrane protein n=1 Tax=Thalassoroseus pseudoceratinae TaxID=2713176 RepID=UPI00142426BA|nr:OmpH family outer membrane protein [Thalassoroseus pseudoceratinae]